MTAAERRERDRAHRRQAIITAARQMAEAEGWDAVTIRRLADRIEYSQPVLYSHFAGKGGIIDAVAVEGFAELHLILRNARQAAAPPKPRYENSRRLCRLRPGASGPLRRHVHPHTGLPFGRPEGPRELHAGFAELREAVTPLAGGRDPDTLAEVAWSALHGIATLTRALGSDRITSRRAWPCW